MTTMIPGEVVVITNYTTIQSLHLTNTYAGLVVTSLISGTSIFLMREGFHLGHLHTDHKDMLSERIPQYVSNESYFGEVTVFRIHG